VGGEPSASENKSPARRGPAAAVRCPHATPRGAASQKWPARRPARPTGAFVRRSLDLVLSVGCRMNWAICFGPGRRKRLARLASQPASECSARNKNTTLKSIGRRARSLRCARRRPGEALEGPLVIYRPSLLRLRPGETTGSGRLLGGPLGRANEHTGVSVGLSVARRWRQPPANVWLLI
jgi:hypothetical protein